MSQPATFPPDTFAADTAASDLAALFERQRAHRWRAAASSVAERRALLQRLGRLLDARRPQLAAAVACDLGKHRAETEVSELHTVLQELKHVRRRLAGWMRPRRAATPFSLFGSRSEVRPEPRGVTLILSPWNYPLLLTLSPLIGALAAGNTAILKPSERTPHTSRALAELIAEAFEPELVTLVQGGAETAEALLRLPFDHIFYTGSGRIGRRVMRAASEHLASVTLELGGKSPAIVDESADLNRAAERVAWGKFVNAGQTCVAPDYALVHEDVLEHFLLALDRVVARRLGGPAWQRHGPDYGRMIDAAAVRRLEDLTRASVAQGARLVFGGTFDPAARFASPTVLADVTPDMPLMREEIFGPVLPVLAYRDLGEVVGHIRANDQPLALYHFTRDPAAQARLMRETTSGALVVNGTIIHLSNPALPFGGVGRSGMGSAHGLYSFRTFSHEKAVLREARLSPVQLTYPPYGRLATRLADWFMRAVDR